MVGPHDGARAHLHCPGDADGGGLPASAKMPRRSYVPDQPRGGWHFHSGRGAAVLPLASREDEYLGERPQGHRPSIRPGLVHHRYRLHLPVDLRHPPGAGMRRRGGGLCGRVEESGQHAPHRTLAAPPQTCTAPAHALRPHQTARRADRDATRDGHRHHSPIRVPLHLPQYAATAAAAASERTPRTSFPLPGSPVLAAPIHRRPHHFCPGLSRTVSLPSPLATLPRSQFARASWE